MINALSPLFTGPLAWLEDRVLLADDAPAHSVPAREVFTSGGLQRMLERHARKYPSGDSRAVLSLWSKYYLAAAIHTPVAARLYLGRELPGGLTEIGLILAATGEVEGLVLPDAGRPAPVGDSAGCFLPLLDANLEPAIQAMAAYSGLSPRVYWSNAGHYFHHLAQTLPTMPGAPATVRKATEVMALRRLADGRRNPLFRPIQKMADIRGTPHMLRRVCCVQFRLPGVGYCANCPLTIERAG